MWRKVVEMQAGTTIMKDSTEIPQKSETRFTVWSSCPDPGKTWNAPQSNEISI